MKNRSFLGTTVLVIAVFVLTSCGGNNEAGTSKQDGNTSSTSIEADGPRPTSPQTVWATGPTTSNNGSPIQCVNDAFQKGYLFCHIYYYVKNVSKIPQIFDGNEFAQTTDGTTFANVQTAGYSGHRELNPGETAQQIATFDLPPEVNIINLFRATTATAPRYYEVALDVLANTN